MEHVDPIWESKIDSKCTHSKMLTESENRALAAARALPELGWAVSKLTFAQVEVAGVPGVDVGRFDRVLGVYFERGLDAF